MNATMTVAPTPPRTVATKPPMPREHGAWGILLIPFATAVGAAGRFDWKLGLLLASILCFYLARTSYLKQNVKWTILLLSLSTGCTLPLLFISKLWWLAGFGLLAAPFAFRKTEHAIHTQILAVAGLTLTAPAAWYVVTGALDRSAWLLWALNALYFVSGVFYVKMHIAAAIRRKPFNTIADKIRHGRNVLVYHVALVVVCLMLTAGGVISPWVMAAFLPVVIRAFVGIGQLQPVLRIKRLGWTEVAYSLVFAALLIAALHG